MSRRRINVMERTNWHPRVDDLTERQWRKVLLDDFAIQAGTLQKPEMYVLWCEEYQRRNPPHPMPDYPQAVR